MQSIPVFLDSVAERPYLCSKTRQPYPVIALNARILHIALIPHPSSVNAMCFWYLPHSLFCPHSVRGRALWLIFLARNNLPVAPLFFAFFSNNMGAKSGGGSATFRGSRGGVHHAGRSGARIIYTSSLGKDRSTSVLMPTCIKRVVVVERGNWGCLGRSKRQLGGKWTKSC